MIVLTHLAAASIGCWFGFWISGILLSAKLADLARENNEMRSQLIAWRYQDSQPEEG